MVKRKLGLGILVLTLVFGMTVVGCDDGSTDGGGLDGTWVSEADEDGVVRELKLNNGNLEISSNGTTIQKGTYTTSGGKITITMTHYNDGNGLQTKAQMLAKYPEMSDTIEAIFTTQTGNYSVSGNKLTLSQGSGSATYTRK
jgi:hypothetical protein